MLCYTVYIGDVRANDQALLMSINRELLGNSFIKVSFILLFVNQIICLTCGLLGFLRSLLSSAGLSCWNLTRWLVEQWRAARTLAELQWAAFSEVCVQLTATLSNLRTGWTLIDLLITASCFQKSVRAADLRAPSYSLGLVTRKQWQAENTAAGVRGDWQLSENARLLPSPTVISGMSPLSGPQIPHAHAPCLLL